MPRRKRGRRLQDNGNDWEGNVRHDAGMINTTLGKRYSFTELVDLETGFLLRAANGPHEDIYGVLSICDTQVIACPRRGLEASTIHTK